MQATVWVIATGKLGLSLRVMQMLVELLRLSLFVYSITKSSQPFTVNK